MIGRVKTYSSGYVTGTKQLLVDTSTQRLREREWSCRDWDHNFDTQYWDSNFCIMHHALERTRQILDSNFAHI